MKKLLIVVLFAVCIVWLVGSVDGAVRTRGYVKKSTGKYVMPHYKSAPNRTKNDNWSTKGNVNPYTGKKGAKRIY